MELTANLHGCSVDAAATSTGNCHSTCTWNQHYLDDDNASVKKAVGVHELGHVYGLWDKSHLDCHNQLNHGAMMNGGATMYNLCGWTTPKVDDVEGVNAIY